MERLLLVLSHQGRVVSAATMMVQTSSPLPVLVQHDQECLEQGRSLESFGMVLGQKMQRRWAYQATKFDSEQDLGMSFHLFRVSATS